MFDPDGIKRKDFLKGSIVALVSGLEYPLQSHSESVFQHIVIKHAGVK